MNKILFIAPYPTLENIKDGMMQRIKAIDMEFESIKRVYLEIRVKKIILFPHIKRTGNVKVIEINLLLHWMLAVFYLLRYRNLYIHSVANCHRIAWFKFFSRKNIILDVHGSVPEEMDFNGRTKLARKLERIERRFFRFSSIIVYVSEQMKKYYEKKYPFVLSKTVVVKPIYSTNVLKKSSSCDEDTLREELGIKPQTTVLIYAGNLQKWQNFDIMLEAIKRIDRFSYHYIILTGELKTAQEKVSNANIPQERVTIRCVSPTELNRYYSISHYGFILRDAHILNQVAAPTKMVEYLYFGLIPIVKFEHIGDAALLGYEYLSVDSLTGNLKPTKSLKNEQIAAALLKESSDNNIFNIAQNIFC